MINFQFDNSLTSLFYFLTTVKLQGLIQLFNCWIVEISRKYWERHLTWAIRYFVLLEFLLINKLFIKEYWRENQNILLTRLTNLFPIIKKKCSSVIDHFHVGFICLLGSNQTINKLIMYLILLELLMFLWYTPCRIMHG